MFRNAGAILMAQSHGSEGGGGRAPGEHLGPNGVRDYQTATGTRAAPSAPFADLPHLRAAGAEVPERVVIECAVVNEPVRAQIRREVGRPQRRRREDGPVRGNVDGRRPSRCDAITTAPSSGMVR